MATAPTKAAWQGYISLGQLGIPVRLYSAIQSIRPKFVQLHESDGSPVERELQCRAEHRKIDSSEVVRAVEVEPGRYITLTDRELEVSVKSPVKSIVVQQFCEPAVVSSLYIDKPYYAVPSGGGERAYALLREVLVRRHKVAIAGFVIRTQEHIAMIGTFGDVLLLQQLRFSAEIVPRQSLQTPALPKPTPAEIDALSAVVDRFSGPLYLEDYHDEYSESVKDLVERKAKGLPARRQERIAPHATPESEIMEAIHETLGERKLVDNQSGGTTFPAM